MSGPSARKEIDRDRNRGEADQYHKYPFIVTTIVASRRMPLLRRRTSHHQEESESEQDGLLRIEDELGVETQIPPNLPPTRNGRHHAKWYCKATTKCICSLVTIVATILTILGRSVKDLQLRVKQKQRAKGGTISTYSTELGPNVLAEFTLPWSPPEQSKFGSELSTICEVNVEKLVRQGVACDRAGMYVKCTCPDDEEMEKHLIPWIHMLIGADASTAKVPEANLEDHSWPFRWPLMDTWLTKMGRDVAGICVSEVATRKDIKCKTDFDGGLWCGCQEGAWSGAWTDILKSGLS